MSRFRNALKSRVLDALQVGPTTSAQLQASMKISKSSITRLMRLLTEEKLVTRERNKDGAYVYNLVRCPKQQVLSGTRIRGKDNRVMTVRELGPDLETGQMMAILEDLRGDFYTVRLASLYIDKGFVWVEE